MLRTLNVVAISLIVSLSLIALRWWIRGNRRILPPGPPADPIIGHLRSIPSERQGEYFHEMAKTYGDIIAFSCLRKTIVVLDSMDIARELLDKRGANYSCRPRLPVFELMGWGPALTFLPYGKRFFKHRKLLQNYFGHRESKAFIPIQLEEARVLVRNMIYEPEDPTHHLSRFTTSVIMRIAFGHQITSKEDVFLEIANDVSHAVHNSGPPGNTPLDLFPLLEHLPSWFPGTHYASWARASYEKVRRVHEYPVQIVKEQLTKGIAQPSFVASQLEAYNDIKHKLDSEALKEEMDDITGAAGIIYGAGGDTLYATLLVFLLAMTLHPECQQKAQDEIDAVIGTARLPDYSDRESLPYVQCIVWETLRWYPAVSLGVPHRAMEDDFYNGMFIPKGSTIIANARGMSLDERIYTNPTAFLPSRFLPEPVGNGEPPFIGVWGFGRRICPGQHMAEAGLWLAIATILSTLNIRRVKDEFGIDIIPEYKFTTGVTNQPVPFKCDIQPRSEEIKNLALL